MRGQVDTQDMRRTLIASLIAMSIVSPAAADGPPPLCRDAKPGAVRYAEHIANGIATHVRYHGCGRWHGDPSQLWFRFTAVNARFGRISYWVRATWHGRDHSAADADGWHYYCRYILFSVECTETDAC